ncbi:aminomethyltransferase family protein [Pacificispira spongiicola]|nr:aminomethyltransferase family protein [Pacificispira spongiicola]
MSVIKKPAMKGVQRGLSPTPFHDFLAPMNLEQSWMDWAGFLSPRHFESIESEYFAIRNQATVFDVSPMRKYRIAGPDALTVMNRLVTRNVAKMRDNRVAYSIWCDEDGNVIDDGTVFRFTATDFRLCCQEPQFSWLNDVAWGFDVEIVDESLDVAGLSLQGPTSYAVLKAAGFNGVETMKPFDIRHFDDGVTVSRTGFTGDLGYELWVPNDKAAALWQHLFAAGRIHGLKPVGYEAVEMTRIEAGLLLPGKDFQSSHHALRSTRGRTPFELGFGWMVDFGKGHFNGRRALLKAKETGPRYMVVGLDIDGNKPAYDALVYHRGKVEAGHVTSALWSPTCKRNLAFAMLKAPYGIGVTDDLFVEIYRDKEGKWEKGLARARIVNRRFFDYPRRAATPPALY